MPSETRPGLLAVPAALTDLVLPSTCAGCAVRGHVLCPPCARPLAGAVSCRPLTGAACPSGASLPVFSVAPYADSVRSAVVAYKDRGRRGLVTLLASALLRAAATAAADVGPEVVAERGLLLVPVPSSRASVRRRGDDPVRRLAVVAAGMGRGQGMGTWSAPLLRVARRVEDQARLGSEARVENVAGSQLVRRRASRVLASGPPVVIVDDVVTTGSTLLESARALRHAGAHVVGAATVAATVRLRITPSDPQAYTSARDRSSVSSWHPPGSVVASDQHSSFTGVWSG